MSAQKRCVVQQHYGRLDFQFCGLSHARRFGALIKECAQLFSDHYGFWNEQGYKPGGSVQLSAHRLRAQCLFDPNTCRLAVARHTSGELAGQAFYCDFLYKPSGRRVIWVTQLVVSSKYRGCRLSTTMLVQPCANKNIFACGLVSSHPYAVKALESASKTICDHALTLLHAERIVRASRVSYIQDRPLVISMAGTSRQSVMVTDFQVCHKEVDAKRSALADWQLGPLESGEEFLALAFPK